MPWAAKTDLQRRRELEPASDRELCRKPRGNTTQRGYGWRWQRARLGFLRRYPLCRTCENDGRTEVACVVDHIVPHKGDMVLFWDRSNWQPLCVSCHNAKTAKEQDNRE